MRGVRLILHSDEQFWQRNEDALLAAKVLFRYDLLNT